MWRRLLFLPPVIIAVVVVYWAVSNRAPPTLEEPAEEVRNVRTIVASRVDLVPRVTGFGTVSPGKTWKAMVQVAGEITYLHPDLKRGRILNKGTEIIRISPSDYEIAAARAKANISLVEAQLAELDVNESNIGETLKIEQEALKIRQRELDRRKQLAESGTLSATALDQDTRDTLSQRKKVLDLQNTLKLIPSQRRALQEQKKLSELELAQAELNLKRTRISLPFDARIAEVEAEMTQFAQVGSTLVTADGIETSEVEAQIPITQFSLLARSAIPNNREGLAITTTTDIQQLIDRLGFSVTIRLDVGSFSVAWPAQFSRLSDTIDLKTRSVGVIVTAKDSWKSAIPGEQPPLSKGLFVNVELRAKPLMDRIVLPRSAIHEDHVYIVDSQDRLKIAPVETGLTQESIVVIREGLSPGDRVVVSDLLPAIEGMLLRPVRDKELESRLSREALGETREAQL